MTQQAQYEGQMVDNGIFRRYGPLQWTGDTDSIKCRNLHAGLCMGVSAV